MLLFVDTNVFLSFYYYGDDDLAALSDLREYLAAQHIEILVTTQVIDEFRRNREQKIHECLRDFDKASFTEKLPRIGEGLQDFDALQKLMSEATNKKKELLKEIRAKAAAKELRADQIIEDIFRQSKVIQVTDEILQKAARRMQVGNPPGKDKSVGDAINWETILANFPVGDDLHIVSRDRDFASPLDENILHGYLRTEYEGLNQRHRQDGIPDATVTLHRSLRSFLKAVAPKVQLLQQLGREFDAERAEAVNELVEARSYFATHRAIANLRRFQDAFAVDEVEAMISAASENDQISDIVRDLDVNEFYDQLGRDYYDVLSPESQQMLDRLAPAPDE